MGAGFGLSLADEVAREEIVQTMSPSCLAQKPSSLQYQHPRQSVLDLAVRTISNALELDLVYIAQLNPLGMGEDRRCSLVSHCGLDVSTASTVKLDPSSHLSALADSLVLQNVDVDRDEAAEGNVLPWWFHSGVNGRGEFFESGCMVPCRIGGENAEEYAHQWVLVALTSDPKRILHAFGESRPSSGQLSFHFALKGIAHRIPALILA